jgi:uncharacterized protein YcbX
MRVVAINRYPVKSFQGNSCEFAPIDIDGLRGDRGWGVRDVKAGKILTARRAPQLLLASATLNDAGEPQVRLPTGVTCDGPGSTTDAALSDWLGKPVELVRATDMPPATAEFFADATDDSSEAIEWTMPENRFVDAAPLLILTTASLRTASKLYADGDWNVRRFRPNLLVEAPGDGWVEDEWCDGRTIAIGDATVTPLQPCVRCTMVTRPQPEIPEDRDIFRALARNHRGNFGVWATVSTPGTVRIDDPVSFAG